MFDADSRYAPQPQAVHRGDQGRLRPYVTLREVPQPVRARPEDAYHVVVASDRLDRVAWQALGDPELFWRLCDANGALHPDDLLAVEGRRLLIPLDGRSGR